MAANVVTQSACFNGKLQIVDPTASDPTASLDGANRKNFGRPHQLGHSIGTAIIALSIAMRVGVMPLTSLSA
ncbi:hypothetical protein ACVWXQ_000097 [Bradyrhizobium sp. S3.14.4]